MYRKEELFSKQKKLARLYKAQVFDLILTVLVGIIGAVVFILSIRYITGMLIGTTIIFLAYMISTKQIKALNKLNDEKDSVAYNIAYSAYKNANNS